MSLPQKKATPVLRKQPIMRRVVIASVPCIAWLGIHLRVAIPGRCCCLLPFWASHRIPVL